MFIATTAVAAWLAWEISCVRARRAFLADLQPGFQVETAEQFAAGAPKRVALGRDNPPIAEIGFVRSLLGHKAIQSIALPAEIDREGAGKVMALFPEAAFAIGEPSPYYLTY